MPTKQRIGVNGIEREVGRDVHPVILHPLCERDDIVKQVFSASSHDIGSREPGEEFGVTVNVGWYHEFRGGRNVSIVFRFFEVHSADVCGDEGFAKGVWMATGWEVEYVGSCVEVVGGIDCRAREGHVHHRRQSDEPSRGWQMEQAAFDDIAGDCQGKVSARGIARHGDILGQESDLTDKVLVCCNCVYDRSWEWIPRFQGRQRTESVVDRQYSGERCGMFECSFGGRCCWVRWMGSPPLKKRVGTNTG